MTYDIAIVDDGDYSRAGLASVGALSKRVRTAVAFATPEELITHLENFEDSLEHTIVLADVELKRTDTDGIRLCQTLKTRWPHLRVIVVSQYSEARFGRAAWNAKANGYVEKNDIDSGLQSVIDSIDAVAVDNHYFQPTTISPNSILSEDDLRILGKVGTGYTLKEIAAQEVQSEGTLRSRWYRIWNHKLRIPDAAKARRFAIKYNAEHKALATFTEPSSTA